MYMVKGGQLMKIQFDSRNGATAVKDGYIVKCIPWKNGQGVWYLWNITVQKAGERDMTDIEAYCQDVPILKMEEIFEWLAANTEITPNKIRQYIRKKLSCRKCDVYKITMSEDYSVKTITDRSEGAGTPALEYPGTQLDTMAD